MYKFISDNIIRVKSSNISSKHNVSKNFVTPRESEKEISAIKQKMFESTLKANTNTNKKPLDRPRVSKSLTQPGKNSATFLREIKSKNKPVTVIHVPLDQKYYKDQMAEANPQNTLILPEIDYVNNKVECSTGEEKELYLKNVTSTGTDAREPDTADKITQIDYSVENANVQVDIIKDTFDSLNIPNVTLTKDKNESKESVVNFHSKSLPNLQVPSMKITPHKDECYKEESDFCKSSYIIGHATVTCTTKQKINIHVVSNSSETTPNQSPSPLAYPMNVVSIYEKEIKKKQLRDTYEQEEKSKAEYSNCLNELKSFNCSYVFNSNKLVKPSDIISTIRVNNGLLQSDYICEQFERELNFIDSFFESLQYLESCSLSEKCFTDNKVKNWISNSEFNVKNSEYGCFLSKLENGANVDDMETMASKSLCLVSVVH